MNACTLHTSHSPANMTVEYHHVIPQAWQRKFVLVAVPPPPPLFLWDPRTVAICPTGHRNVHTIIVAAMHHLADANSEDFRNAIYLVARKGLQRDTAELALERFAAAGGKLLDLVAAGEWGEA